MRDAQLSPSFRLSSWPCWEYATATDAITMRWVARYVLQPTVDRWGPLWITSWKRWKRSGCTELRTGDHEDAGTVDLVPAEADITEVWAWMGANLRDRYGSLIDERDHIHYTRPGVGVAPGGQEFLTEPVEGSYRLATVGPREITLAGAATVAGLLLLTKLWERSP